jgi:hypothetical protein
MSTARTKIFGMDLGVDPKVVVLVLLILAAAVYYFTSSSDPSGGSSSPAAAVTSPVARPAMSPVLAAARNRRMSRTNRDVLKLVPVDGSRGDVDPTLHLRLLDRVKNVPPAAGLRNLFDAAGSQTVAQNMPPVPAHPPILQPKPPVPPSQMSAMAAGPVTPPFSIPLKYYGFAKPRGRALDGSRGLFLDGDNILIGAEGDLLEKHFLIVSLTPTMARLEDTRAKQGQDIPVTPEAPPAQ